MQQFMGSQTVGHDLVTDHKHKKITQKTVKSYKGNQNVTLWNVKIKFEKHSHKQRIKIYETYRKCKVQRQM